MVICQRVLMASPGSPAATSSIRAVRDQDGKQIAVVSLRPAESHVDAYPYACLPAAGGGVLPATSAGWSGGCRVVEAASTGKHRCEGQQALAGERAAMMARSPAPPDRAKALSWMGSPGSVRPAAVAE